MDNYCDKGGFVGELGLSLLVQVGRAKLLFDTGATGSFLNNARRLGIDLSDLGEVVLSHGHYDHSGGVAALYALLSDSPPPLFAGRGYDVRRFAVSATERRSIGLPFEARPAGMPEPILIERAERLEEGVFVLPRADMIDGSEIPSRFRTLSGGVEAQDDFSDELALAVIEEGGLTVISGCAHRGIVNIVRAALLAFPGIPLKAVVGGFHFSEADEAGMRQTAEALAALKPEKIFCSHCTGVRGFAALAAALPGKISWLACGASVTI
jgi:7,8-dihydropterin-6-yl-methyl-4-(beta-D-ribofuranosyl)aminobenzene 5'-phosphate synthase